VQHPSQGSPSRLVSLLERQTGHGPLIGRSAKNQFLPFHTRLDNGYYSSP
jgi:hypothetical protein